MYHNQVTLNIKTLWKFINHLQKNRFTVFFKTILNMITIVLKSTVVPLKIQSQK